MSDNQEEKNDRLLEVRKALGMTQAEMAELLGMDRGNLSNIEKRKNGRNVPKDASYILAHEKGVNFKWFETGEGSMFMENFNPNNPRRSSQQRWFGEDNVEERVQLPGDPDGVRLMRVDSVGENNNKDQYSKPSVEEKLAFALERNQEISDKAMAALEKNVHLLEEISNLKDLLLEKEREIFHIKSPAKTNPHDPVGAR